MSISNTNEEEVDNKLSLVIRKPQSGKTYICITSIINDPSKNIHIVLTMNTLDSGEQFMSRMLDKIDPNQIIVFNSKKETDGGCHYAKDSDGVNKLLMENHEKIKVIICCAHTNRICKSIPNILNWNWDRYHINIQFTIHIDEAHKYIPENRKCIKDYNKSPKVSKIIGYTASPDPIYTKKQGDLFHKIPIWDVETDLAIIRATHYFGVKDCVPILYNELDENDLMNTITDEIPEHIIKLSNGCKNNTWYGEDWTFNNGNELLMLGFLNYILPTLQIADNNFSYHFVPAYSRIPTHYKTADIILTHYPNANVITINGNGFQLFRFRKGKMYRITPFFI